MVRAVKLWVGLTGGMGSGKSTAAGMFADLGFSRLDADRTIREEIWRSPEVIAAATEKLGRGVVAPDGGILRNRVAEIVFQDEAALAWLEELLHPRLLARWREVLAAGGDKPYIIEVPLLFEKGLENWFDFIVCVSTDSGSQLRRLEKRGIPRELAHQRLAKQLPLARKCELADHVLLNDGTPEFLREQVTVLADRLLQSQPDRPAGRIHGSSP